MEAIVGNESKKKFKIEKPDIEIVVRVGETELAVLAFFSAGGEGWDVVVGIDSPANRDAIASAFDAAAEAVRGAAFRPIPTNQHEGGYNPPF
jgi:hypothetical protein